MQQFADDLILTSAFKYWIELPGQAGIPDRRVVDPSQMPTIVLPNVALLELIDDGSDAQFRLAGREFEENFGFSLKGRRISELINADDREYMLSHLHALVEGRGPIYSESNFQRDRGGHLRTRRILMPLSHGQPGEIAMILKVQTWPREKMRGLPFYEAIANISGICHYEPQFVGSKSG